MADISKISVNNTTYNLKDSRIPNPSGSTTNYLRGDGTWATPTVSTMTSASDVSDEGTSLLITPASSPAPASATTFVTGTFTTGSSAGVGSVTVDYSGDGYPVMCVVVVDGGAYVSGTDWYTSVQRYAVGQWTMTKSVFSSTPTYTTSGAANQGVTTWIFKNSTSSSTTYSRSSAMNTNAFSSSSASNAGATCVRFNSNTDLSYYVNTTSYGLHPDTTYRYFIQYSA